MAVRESPITIAVGDALVSGAYARPARTFATLVLAHGSGTGMDHPFLSGFTRALNDDGVATLRFNFPYREAGRKFPTVHPRRSPPGGRRSPRLRPARAASLCGPPASPLAGAWRRWR